MTNSGTIDATLDLADYVDGFTQSGKVCYDMDSDEKMSENECIDVGSYSGAVDIYNFDNLIFEKTDGTLALTEEDSNEFTNSDGSIIRLKPGESMYLLIRSYARDYSSNNKYFATTDVTYNFNWKQKAN